LSLVEPVETPGGYRSPDFAGRACREPLRL